MDYIGYNRSTLLLGLVECRDVLFDLSVPSQNGRVNWNPRFAYNDVFKFSFHACPWTPSTSSFLAPDIRYDSRNTARRQHNENLRRLFHYRSSWGILWPWLPFSSISKWWRNRPTPPNGIAKRMKTLLVHELNQVGITRETIWHPYTRLIKSVNYSCPSSLILTHHKQQCIPLYLVLSRSQYWPWLPLPCHALDIQ